MTARGRTNMHAHHLQRPPARTPPILPAVTAAAAPALHHYALEPHIHGATRGIRNGVPGYSRQRASYPDTASAQTAWPASRGHGMEVGLSERCQLARQTGRFRRLFLSPQALSTAHSLFIPAMGLLFLHGRKKCD